MANISTETFGTSTGILQYPHFKARAQYFAAGDAAAVNGVIKAGTIYPTNDKNAQGVVLQDVVVPGNGALIYEGDLRTSKLPAAPTDAARRAIPRVTFFPITPYAN